MKNLKKLLALMLALVFAFAMCACGNEVDDDDAQTGIANPIVESTQQGVLEATGIEIAAPEGAEDVEYSYCEKTEDSFGFAQVDFEYQDNDYCYRIQMTDQLSMYGGEPGEEANLEELMKALNDGTNVGAQLAGMYYEWEASGTTVVDYCDGVFAFNQGEEGFIAWLDVVPGALYSLSMDDDCTQDLLNQMAGMIFQPMQGDA